jgi:alpha-tubulin suppressor-like RCC1 family protein
VKILKCFISLHIPAVLTLAVFGLVCPVASADTVNAVFHSAADVPVTASGYTATGNTVNFTLNFAPAPGTDLMVVNNTGLPFIVGTFDNLAQGQGVALSHSGVAYTFVANYYGGNGNDLVLVWTSTRAFAWGYNSMGQIGDNSTTERLLPVRVSATGVLSADGVTPAVTAPGVLAGKTVLAMTAGMWHSLALCSDGTLAAWGNDYAGQLGDNISNTNRLVPVAVNTAPGVSALFGKTVVAIAAGPLHSVALCSDGTVAAWGDNSGGELGDHTIVWRYAPVAVNTNSGLSALYGKTVVAIAVGNSHNLALCSDGSLAGWGGNSYGQLGNNGIPGGLNTVPVAVNTNSGVSALYGKTVMALAAGYNHSLALCSDGTVAAWGANYYGQLGDNAGGQPGDKSLVPVAVSADTNSALYGKTVVAIAAGDWHSLALCSDGTVAAWGHNDYGELGNNTTNSSLVPVAVNTAPGVSALYGKTVVAVAAGHSHSAALCSDGTLASWGDNTYGKLGDNTTVQRNAPVAVNTTPLAASQRFARIWSGPMADHTLALVAAPPAAPIMPTGAPFFGHRFFSITFTNTPGGLFDVVASTNMTLPLSNWTPIGDAPEVSSGQFQLLDGQFGGIRVKRFYRVRSP